MEYYEIIGLKKEPFSMTPDPEFFYQSKSHGECIDRLEISLRLNRGLNVIIGGVGTGKTMLSRLLLGRFVNFGLNYKFHLILDPTWDSNREFLQYLSKMFGLDGGSLQHSEMMDRIEHYLIDSSIYSKRNNVLIIDEGQKMGENQLEIIRMLLNFETNDAKLVQVIIFAQHEMKVLLNKHENFRDRIAFGYELKPLDLDDTNGFITHRLHIAGLQKGENLFSMQAVEIIHEETKGYPRKIVKMCHHLIIEMILTRKENISSEDVFKFKKESNSLHV